MDTYALLPKTWWLKEPQDSRATVRDLNSLWYEFYASLVAAPRLTPQVICYSRIVQGEPKFQGLSHVKGTLLTNHCSAAVDPNIYNEAKSKWHI